ncbi:MAG: arylesterase [SAR324 cluster bacterium]|nr:arylesterase [SAR324 cluster bacterium]
MKAFFRNFIPLIYLGICGLIFFGSFVSSAEATSTIVFLGDSLTEGYGLDKSEAFPALFEKELQAEGYKDIKVINAGISGSTSASAISRLKWYLRIKPSILVIALGANDGLRGLDPDAMKKNLATTIQLALDRKITVVLAGMKIPPNYGLKYTEEFENVYPELSEKFNIPLIPFLLDGVAANPELNLPDGIHPNQKGHEIIARLVLKELRPLLPQS